MWVSTVTQMPQALGATRLDLLQQILHIYAKSNNDNFRWATSLEKNVENLLKITSNLDTYIQNPSKVTTDFIQWTDH